MEFKEQGLLLTDKEGLDLAEVVSATVVLNDWGPLSGVVKEPTVEEKEIGYDLWQLIRDSIYRREEQDTSEPIINSQAYPAIVTVAELALANTTKIVDCLCTPDVCSGYRPEWRPEALRVMSMIAEISEKIQRIQRDPGINLDRLNGENKESAQDKLKRLGASIKTRRQSLGFSALKLANQSGISRNYLNQIEKGEQNKSARQNTTKAWRPSRRVLINIADSLRLPLEEILLLAGYETSEEIN